MVFQAVRTRFPLRIAAGMTELGLLQEPQMTPICLIVLDIPEPFPYDLGEGSGCAMHKGQAESVNNSGGGDVPLHEALSADAALRSFLFYHYRFTLHATSSPAFFNGDVGAALRGAFGSVLREIVCIDRHQECPACSIRAQCVFPMVFSPVRESGICPKRQQTPPRGFVIKPPVSSKKRYDPREALVFDFILAGRLKDYLPYIIVPFKELGRRGIGMGLKRRHRYSATN